MDLANLVRGIELQPTALVDIGLTAVLIYGLLSLIRGTRAVRLVIGLTILIAVYLAAQALGLQLLSQILQTGAVVGLLAIVVVFQPELRRALERIGRVGSLGWLMAPGSVASVERVVVELSRASSGLAAERIGALIVLERETGLEDFAETGVMLHADLHADLLRTIFTPRAPLHDGAVIVRGERIVAAGVVLPLSETAVYRERFGTRHRAALGITEQTDALAIVVSEESGAVSLVERGRILRHLDEERLRTALLALLRPGSRPARAALGAIPGADRSLARALKLRSGRARRGGRRPSETQPPDASRRPADRAAAPTPAPVAGPREQG
jgi:diadenylate cyclase